MPSELSKQTLFFVAERMRADSLEVQKKYDHKITKVLPRLHARKAKVGSRVEEQIVNQTDILEQMTMEERISHTELMFQGLLELVEINNDLVRELAQTNELAKSAISGLMDYVNIREAIGDE